VPCGSLHLTDATFASQRKEAPVASVPPINDHSTAATVRCADLGPKAGVRSLAMKKVPR